MRVWIDIDSPTQVRYLLPIARRFQASGDDVLLTARAFGDTFSILRSEGAEFEAIGVAFGEGSLRKLQAVGRRALALLDFIDRRQTPVDLVVTGSRAAMLAARKLGLPNFAIVDHEYVNLLLYDLCRTQIVHPSAISADAFRRRGIDARHLVPFDGLKEDISFAELDVASVAAHEFGDTSEVRVLFRPPSEGSRCFRRESLGLSLELLRHLALRDTTVVFSPRTPQQVSYLDEVPRWKHEPIVLRRPVPSVSLLKGVDAVVSAGGTMLREAAFLGVPAYSVLRGTIGGVDRYLASVDRLVVLGSPSDFGRLSLVRNGSIDPLRTGTRVLDQVLELIRERADRKRFAPVGGASGN